MGTHYEPEGGNVLKSDGNIINKGDVFEKLNNAFDENGNLKVSGIGGGGVDGKSAYQSYVDTTIDNPVLTEEEWVLSLHGADAETLVLDLTI
jgi:hypothetical protein